jgi:hypothetical protein
MIQFLKDFWGYMRTHKKYWMAPIVLTLLSMGLLLSLTQKTAVAPFVYTLF